MIAAAAADVSFPAVEAAVYDGQVVVATNTHEPGKRISLVIIGSEEVTRRLGVPIHHLESGPLVWEISDGLYYRGGIGRLPPFSWDTAIVGVSARGMADLVGLARTNGGVDRDAARTHALRLNNAYGQYYRRVTPIADLIKEHATELEDEWTLSMDIVCVDRTLTIVLATYEGELYSWEARTDQNGEYE